jgi:outer membrane protein W
MMIFKKSVAALLLVFLATTLFAGGRDRKMEFFFIPQYIDGKNLDFNGGAKAEIDSSVSFGFGFGYNFDANWNLGLLFSYAEADYDGTYDNNGTLETNRHTVYTSSINLVGTYNFLRGNFTPFVSGHIGYTHTNTGISNGEIYIGCPPYYDPLFPGYCYPYEGAHTDNSLNYGGFAGVRYDFDNGFFLKGAVGVNVIDYNSHNLADFTLYQLTLGSTF